jgi:hypothetical protein
MCQRTILPCIIYLPHFRQCILDIGKLLPDGGDREVAHILQLGVPALLVCAVRLQARHDGCVVLRHSLDSCRHIGDIGLRCLRHDAAIERNSKAGVLLIANDGGDTVVYDLVKKLFVYIINNRRIQETSRQLDYRISESLPQKNTDHWASKRLEK